MMIEQVESISTQKSRSETPSMLFSVTPSKPSALATISRSVGYVVPASAHEPRGETFILFTVSPRRLTSRMNIIA